MGLFGMPYEADPTGALLGQNYNSQIEQEQKLWGLLTGAGQALLNPKQGAGSLATLGNAAVAGTDLMQKAGTDYLATALTRQQTQQKLLDQQREAAERTQMEKDAVGFMGQFSPDIQKAINSNPQMAAQYWEAFLKDRATGGGGSGSSNIWAPGQPVIQADGTLGWGRPNLRTGEVKVVPLPPGTTAAVSPENAGAKSAATTRAAENEKKLANVPLAINASQDIISNIDDIMSRPDLQQYLGMNSVWATLPGNQTRGVMKELQQLAGQYRMQALPIWKGSGPFSEAEGESAVSAAMAAEQAQTPADFYFSMAKSRWHAEAARRIALAQYEAGDTFKYFDKKVLMKDVPYPKREDYLNAGTKPKGGSPTEISDELQKALDAYPD